MVDDIVYCVVNVTVVVFWLLQDTLSLQSIAILIIPCRPLLDLMEHDTQGKTHRQRLPSMFDKALNVSDFYGHKHQSV